MSAERRQAMTVIGIDRSWGDLAMELADVNDVELLRLVNQARAWTRLVAKRMGMAIGADGLVEGPARGAKWSGAGGPSLPPAA